VTTVQLSRAADSRMVWFARVLTRLCAVLCVGIAALALVGWLGHVDFLKALRSRGVPMNSWSAVGLITAAVALWLLADESASGGGRRVMVAQALAVGVALLGLQRLIAYLMEISRAMDQGLPLHARGMRMAPNSAWCFLFAGASLALLDVDFGPRRFRPAAWLALLPGAVGLLAIAGYVYGLLNLFAVSNYIEMPLNSALCFVVLAVGTEPTDALVLSQVVLSFCVPFALVPLVLMTSRRAIMGRHVNAPVTIAAAGLVTVVIVALNVYLLVAQLS